MSEKLSLSQPSADQPPVAPRLSPSEWAHVPLQALHAELLRRRRRQEETGGRPECGSGRNLDDYDVSAHVFAVALILILSTLGRYLPLLLSGPSNLCSTACSFPILARHFPRLPIPHHFLFLSRHFGTGVLIATAFVHLLPTAFTSLTDPCLSPFWNEQYRPMAGFIAMISVLVIVGIEMFFATRGAGHMHGSGLDAPPPEARADGRPSHSHSHSRNSSSQHALPRRFRQTPFGGEDDDDDDEEMQRLRPAEAANGWTAVSQKGTGGGLDSIDAQDMDGHRGDRRALRRDSDDESDLGLDELDDPQSQASAHAALVSSSDSGARPRHKQSSSLSHQHNPMMHIMPSDPVAAQALERRLLLQCLLLEAGILFHSVFVGMAVSVSTGPAFVVLLVAISFHQTFEGLALGARIAAIPTLSPSNAKPWLMALAYGTTTPIGQVIGLGARRLYDPQGEMGLLMVGIMNAISSGLLLFAGLVELLAEDFLSDSSYAVLRGWRRKQACASVVSGAVLMALVGAFA